MRRYLFIAHKLLQLFGLDVPKARRALMGLPRYFRGLRELKSQQQGADGAFPLGQLYPCLREHGKQSGTASGQYFHQDLLVARRVHENSPERHVDVGSRVDGFVAHVASFREIEVMDIREQTATVPNIRFIRADLMGDLDPSLVGYCDSLSCLHALEHFGLGRYGDPIRYDGHIAGLANLRRIVKQGGKLYISVPVGPQRIEFNAHRVFAVRHLLDLIEPHFCIDHFSFIDEAGELHEDVELAPEEVRRNFGCRYGCGILETTKRDP